MSEKIISLQKYRRKKLLTKFYQNKKMLFLSIVLGALIGNAVWNFYVEDVESENIQIPQSLNLVFNDQKPIALTTAQIANQFESADGKPILLYIYTTWCKICSKNFPAINEVAREFQNSDLKIITLAIDRNLSAEQLSNYLNGFGNVYFQPSFLTFKDGFLELLEKRHISYNGRIPFTVLIGRDGEIITKFVGAKSVKFLRKRVIKSLS